MHSYLKRVRTNYDCLCLVSQPLHMCGKSFSHTSISDPCFSLSTVSSGILALRNVHNSQYCYIFVCCLVHHFQQILLDEFPQNSTTAYHDAYMIMAREHCMLRMLYHQLWILTDKTTPHYFGFWWETGQNSHTVVNVPFPFFCMLQITFTSAVTTNCFCLPNISQTI